MRGEKRVWPAASAAGVLAFIVAAMFMLSVAGGAVVAADTAPASVADGPSTVSEAVHAALTAGPAARQLERQQQRRALGNLQKEQAYKPAWQLTAGAGMAPDLRADAALSMNWALSDTLAMRLHVPVGSSGASGGSSTGTGAAGQRVTLSWAQPLWPTADAALAADVEQLETYIVDITLHQHMLDTVEQAVSLSYELQQAASEAVLSEETIRLARNKTEYAQQMYEQGVIGLDRWQREQQQYTQAQQAWQRSTVRRLEAYAAWLDMTGNTAAPVQAEHVHIPVLTDDVPWEAWAEAVIDALRIPYPPPTPERPLATDGILGSELWEQALLAHNGAYKRALLTVKQREAALAKARHDALPAVGADAQISHSLQAASAQWSVGVRATWDLGPQASVQIQQSELDLSEAKDGLVTARDNALARGRTLWIGVSDALHSVQLAQESLDQSLAAADIVARRVRAGLAPAADEDEARLEVARHRLALTSARQQLNVAWLRLGHAVGMSVVTLPG